MTDLVVTPTEARRDFFNLHKLAGSGKRKVRVEGKDWVVNWVVDLKPKKVEKKLTWEDFAGGLSDKMYKDIKRASKMVEKVSTDSIKRW
ncbi:MAG: hypothetical protein WAV41_02815 [Microgenomates group bacterium]